MSFCVKCGADGPVYDSVCEKCFLQGRKFTMIADHVNLLRCNHCREYGLDNKWVQCATIEEAAEMAAISGVQVHKDAHVENFNASIVPADAANFRVHLDVSVECKGLGIEEQLDTIVRLKNSVCGRCSMIMGSYFESILQIRSRDRKLTDKEVDDMLNRVHKLVGENAVDNRDVFISKVDRMVGGAGGADVYLSSNSVGKIIARSLADQYGAEVKESAKLVTKREGKDVYRVSYLVRLPSYRFGDVAMFRKKMFLVGPMRTTNARLTDMRTGENINHSHIDLQDVKVIATNEDMIDVVVLSETDREVQIMHPTSYQPVELRKPNKFHSGGETVRVFIHEEEIYLLPKQ